MFPARRRLVSSCLAAIGLLAGFFSASSCASARVPGAGGPLHAYAAGYELTVLADGVPLPTFERGGQTYVLGQIGQRYTLRITNHTGRRIEAVAAVDGRDAIDGRPGDYRSKRGYLVPAWGSIEIDGWRLSRAEVAAFRFSSVAESYAARTGGGRDVGVIGVAVFPERARPRPVYAPPPPYVPYRRYDWRYEEGDEYGSRSYGGEDKNNTAPSASAESGRSSPPSPPATASPPSGGRAAEASPAPADRIADGATDMQRRRPGLGTEFGEAMTSPVQEVSFVRADATHPSAVLGVRYNDRDGLVALGIDVDGPGCCGDDDLAWRQSASPFPVSDRRFAAPPAGWPGGCCVR